MYNHQTICIKLGNKRDTKMEIVKQRTKSKYQYKIPSNVYIVRLNSVNDDKMKESAILCKIL